MSKIESQLKQKIISKKAKIAVVGLGYVGLPLVCEFAENGFKVCGIDLDKSRIEKIKKGQSYVEDIPSTRLKSLVKKNRINAFNDFEILSSIDVVIVCVPTPLNRVRDPDISYIASATKEIEKRLHPGMLVVLESTTYPGTTEEVILPSLEKSNLRVGKDFFLCFSPERIDPGNKVYATKDIPKVVGGITARCGKLAAHLYSKITPKVVQVSSSRTAEMTKLLENTFRIVNIGLVNELAKAAESLDVDIWEAIDAAKTKPFGYMPFYPGPGIGGHCIAVDPLYLSWKARMHGTDLHFIELARRMNTEMPEYIVSKVVYTLNQYLGKAISQSKVLLLGVSYKKDVRDTRESPAIDILHQLERLGANVSYHDPFVPKLTEGDISIESIPFTVKNLKKQDLVILTTNHSKFQKNIIAKNCRLIFDTRNFFKGMNQDHIIKL